MLSRQKPARIMNKRRKLSAEELEDSARLKMIWNAFKNAEKGRTQEWLAHYAELGTQGSVNQYLNAVIPLNLEALLKFAKAFDIDPAKISPSLAGKLKLANEQPPPSELVDNRKDTSFSNRNDSKYGEKPLKDKGKYQESDQPKNFSLKDNDLPVTSLGAVRRIVTVRFSCKLAPGEFVQATDRTGERKYVEVVPSEYTPEAFVLTYEGDTMGEILEHGQPLIATEYSLISGDLYLLENPNNCFMLAVFLFETLDELIFKPKGKNGEQARFKKTFDMKKYRILASKNQSDVKIQKSA